MAQKTASSAYLSNIAFVCSLVELPEGCLLVLAAICCCTLACRVLPECPSLSTTDCFLMPAKLVMLDTRGRGGALTAELHILHLVAWPPATVVLIIRAFMLHF